MRLPNNATEAPPQELFARFREVVRRPREWVWHGLVARRSLTLLTGEPGSGKTIAALQMAASVTRGLLVPVPPQNSHKTYKVHPEMQTDPGDVLLLTANDSLSESVAEWIDASEADVDRIYFLRNQLDFDRQTLADATEARKAIAAGWEQKFDQIEAAIRQLIEQGADLRLILIDPIEQLLSQATRPADRDRIVERLQQLAIWTGAAVVVVANSTPAGTGRNGFRAVSKGHVELATAARSILMVAHDLEHLDQRILIPVKMNLAPFRGGLSLKIDQIRDDAHPVTGSKISVNWGEEPVAENPQTYFARAKALLRNPRVLELGDELNRASHWLKERMADGTCFSVDIRNDAIRAEITESTLNQAFQRLGCISVKIAPKKWVWRLPMEEYNEDQRRRETRVEEKRQHRLHCAYEWEGSSAWDHSAEEDLAEQLAQSKAITDSS